MKFRYFNFIASETESFQRVIKCARQAFGRSAYFILPIAVWLFLFKDFFSGQAVISNENFSQYSILKFYLDNLTHGVYPLWNPFILWGTPDLINLINLGPFNPVWLLTFFLNKAGMHFYQAYLGTIVFYFFFGLWGFYLLAKKVLGNSLSAYAAWVMMMFSSLCMPMFTQLMMILLFVPAVWFFYFFLSFSQFWHKKYFLGAMFCLAMIVSTYLPFYFLTIFLAVLIFYVVLYPADFLFKFKRTIRFLREHALLSILCFFIVILSSWPAAELFLDIQAHNLVVPFRHHESEDTYTKGVVMDEYFKTTNGDVSARMTGEDLFSYLDQIEYGNDGFFYVPIFCYLVLLAGLFNKCNRRIVLYFLLTVILFLICITNAGSLHPFLFKYVFYFKFFRNLHYLLPFLLSVFILLVAEQLKGLMEAKAGDVKARWLFLIYFVGLHLLCWFFLKHQESVIISSFATIVLSLIFFILLYFYKFKNSGLQSLLLLVIIVQPIEVLTHYLQQAKQYRSEVVANSLKVPLAKPQFSFARGQSGTMGPTLEDTTRSVFDSYRITMTDPPGDFIPFDYGFPTFGVYTFVKNIPPKPFPDTWIINFLFMMRCASSMTKKTISLVFRGRFVICQI